MAALLGGGFRDRDGNEQLHPLFARNRPAGSRPAKSPRARSPAQSRPPPVPALRLRNCGGRYGEIRPVRRQRQRRSDRREFGERQLDALDAVFLHEESAPAAARPSSSGSTAYWRPAERLLMRPGCARADHRSGSRGTGSCARCAVAARARDRRLDVDLGQHLDVIRIPRRCSCPAGRRRRRLVQQRRPGLNGARLTRLPSAARHKPAVAVLGLRHALDAAPVAARR